MENILNEITKILLAEDEDDFGLESKLIVLLGALLLLFLCAAVLANMAITQAISELDRFGMKIR